MLLSVLNFSIYWAGADPRWMLLRVDQSTVRIANCFLFYYGYVRCCRCSAGSCQRRPGSGPGQRYSVSCDCPLFQPLDLFWREYALLYW